MHEPKTSTPAIYLERGLNELRMLCFSRKKINLVIIDIKII